MSKVKTCLLFKLKHAALHYSGQDFHSSHLFPFVTIDNTIFTVMEYLSWPAQIVGWANVPTWDQTNLHCRRASFINMHFHFYFLKKYFYFNILFKLGHGIISHLSAQVTTPWNEHPPSDTYHLMQIDRHKARKSHDLALATGDLTCLDAIKLILMHWLVRQGFWLPIYGDSRSAGW